MGKNMDITRQIVDIVDWGTIFKNQWYKRKKFYDEKKYPITVSKIDYEDMVLTTKEPSEDKTDSLHT